MKNFLLALMVVLTTCTLAVAQNQNPVAHDSISQAESTLVVDTDTTDSIAKENITTTDTSNHSVLYSLSNAMEDVLIPIIAIIAVFGFPVFILPESTLSPCRTGSCCRTAASGRFSQRGQAE